MSKQISEKYTLESIKKSVQLFIEREGREPSFRDFNGKNGLPSARQIQRRFGGLPAIRKVCGLKIENYTTGTTRSKIAKKIQEKCSTYEADLINKLFLKHHDVEHFTTTVTRHFAYQQWLPDEKHYINIASDVGITDRIKKHVILIDFFYPADMYSFDGCVRIKRKKLRDHPVSLFNCTHEVLFVCVNEKIKKEFIVDGIRVVSLATFTNEFLTNTNIRTPLEKYFKK